MDFIVLVVSAFIFLFSAWFYTVSDSGIGKSDEKVLIKEIKNDTKKENSKDEIVVNYYTTNQKEEQISKIDTAKLEQLTQSSSPTFEQKQPKLQSKDNKQIVQTPYAQPSIAMVVNPQSNPNISIKSSQIPPQLKSTQSVAQPSQMKSSFGSNTHTNNSSGSFTVITPPSLPQIGGMDTPPPIPTITASSSSESSTIQNDQSSTNTTNNGDTGQQTSSKTKLEGPPQIGQ